MIEVRLRPLAEDDLVDQVGYYRDAAGEKVAGRFFDEAIDALGTIREWPEAGSPRIGIEIGIEGLRTRSIPGFPLAGFYFAHQDHADVVRLLGWSQDVAALLGELGE